MRILRACRLCLLLCAVLAGTAMGGLSYYAARRALTDQILNHLQSVASVQRSRVEALLSRDRERFNLLASRTQLRLSLASYLRDRKPEDAERMRRILNDALDATPAVRTIQVLSPEGVVLESTEPAQVGRPAARRAVWEAGRTAVVVGVFEREADGILEVQAGPLVLASETLGVLVLAARTKGYEAVVGDYSGLGRTGETVLLGAPAGADPVILLPARHDPEAALRREVPFASGAASALAVQAGEETLFPEAIDYRGAEVLAASAKVPGTTWTVLAKIDAEEAYEPVRRLALLLASVGALVLAAVALIAVRFARTLTGPVLELTQAAERMAAGHPGERPHGSAFRELDVLARTFNSMANALGERSRELERRMGELFQERQKLERITESVGAGLAVISPDFEIVWANSVVRRTYGEEAVGAKCYAAFKRGNSVCPTCGVAEVFGQGAQEVVHEQEGVDTQGNAIWNQVVVTPLRDEAGEVTAALEVLVPITDRKRAEVEQLRLIEELRVALAQVKTLSGLIPICASCKKIRDDKGYWNQLEAYLTEHSEMVFSHGICPECRERLYPDLPPRTK